MKRPAPEAPPLRRSALERHFLALAIVATAACAGTVIADAAAPAPAGHIDLGNGAAPAILDKKIAASGNGEAR